MPCYLKKIPQRLMVDDRMKKGKKQAKQALEEAYRKKKISLIQLDELRRQIDACVEVGHPHIHLADGTTIPIHGDKLEKEGGR